MCKSRTAEGQHKCQQNKKINTFEGILIIATMSLRCFNKSASLHSFMTISDTI